MSPLRQFYPIAFAIACFLQTLVHTASLPEAARIGDRAAVRSLLSENASVDEGDNKGNTALHWAALNGDSRLAELLLSAGALVDATNDSDATPLIYAIHTPKLVEVLLEHGADPNHATNLNRTPLLAAASRPESNETVRLLLKHGADSDPILMVSDRIEDFEMPPLSKRDDHPALSPQEVTLLETWINEGLVWE